MIYLDSDDFPVNEHYDGGDSAVRAGILAMTCSESDWDPFATTEMYHVGDGNFVRHPKQTPWNNPKNFSRDQLMMLIPSLSPTNARKALLGVVKRFGFAQNTERDAVGTTKYPWPHKVDGEWRMFDYADPLLPNHWGALILRSKLYFLYPLLLVSYLFHLVTLYAHSKGNHYEENQMIAESYVYGTLKLFVKWKPNWVDVSKEYWGKRNEIEYHNLLVNFIKFQTNDGYKLLSEIVGVKK